MTKILNLALKIKGVVGRVAHVKSSDPAIPQNFERALECIIPSSAHIKVSSIFLYSYRW